MNTPHLAPGVLIEQVGDDLLVVTPDGLNTLRLTGQAAAVMSRIQAGQPIDFNTPIVQDLAERGIIALPGMSRRGLIKAGAIGAGAGIAVLAMPSVAAASSGEGLTGTLYAAIWGGETLYPNISTRIGATDPDWVGAILGVTDPPYSVAGVANDQPILDGGAPLQGTVSTGGVDYTAYLYMFEGSALWLFLGASGVPADGADFVLTFTFGGTPYRVTPAVI